MTRPRRTLVSLDATAYYHCVSRCVRRAFLCGRDAVTGRNYEHRRGWIEERMLALAQVFALDVCAYAVMSNHFHVVLHVDAATARGWSDVEVAERWHRLFKGNHYSQKLVRGEALDAAERMLVDEMIEQWRGRLVDISWFMRVLNESIAREANREDGCTGRFWEGRFKSQALLDEKALAACMAYVDLNPVRAALAETPETSDHTSVKRRIAALREAPDAQPSELAPFAGNPREGMAPGIPMRLAEYLELVDWTGRVLRPGKRGAIPARLPPLLERLQIEPKQWLMMAGHFESRFRHLVGAVASLRRACASLGYRRTAGLRPCTEAFASG